MQRQQSFLDGLVEGRGADPHFAVEAAETLGVAVDEPVACVVAPFMWPSAPQLYSVRPVFRPG